MGRLTGRGLPPRLAPGPSRLRGPGHGLPGEGPARRSADWLNTARWQRLRLRIAKRDGWVCQATGVALVGRYPAANSLVVDHIVPHRGDPALFWDETNLRAVSKAWHDSVKQGQEKRGLAAAVAAPAAVEVTPGWMPRAAIPAVLVCGPPAAGKTAHVAAHAAEPDRVIDLDRIVAEIGGLPFRHDWDAASWLAPAMAERNRRLAALSRARSGRAWVIASAPTFREREWWREAVGVSRIVLLPVPAAECLRRAEGDTDRDMEATCLAVARWWRRYERVPGESLVETL